MQKCQNIMFQKKFGNIGLLRPKLMQKYYEGRSFAQVLKDGPSWGKRSGNKRVTPVNNLQTNVKK